ncbi:MAG TPA: c-type cytochrome [Burkholderiales bacterium]|nr:c-type cytochrome [Burkholderiales bacterium]
MDVRLIAAALASACMSAAAYGQVAVKGDPAKAQQIVTSVCAACHGADGNSAIPTNPSIAGQPAEYVYKQLNNFKSAGGKPAERPSAVMTAMVANLSSDDMANLAAYFASKEAKPRDARNAELVKIGQTIYRGGVIGRGVPACASCHGANGAGIPAQFPRLGAQHAQYTADQLKAFRAGSRANDPNHMMRAIATKLTDREIDAVAQYVQGLR